MKGAKYGLFRWGKKKTKDRQEELYLKKHFEAKGIEQPNYYQRHFQEKWERGCMSRILFNNAISINVA